MKWSLIITTTNNGFGIECYTYRQDTGYIFEGILLNIKDAIKYFKPYLKLLDENPSMRYDLSSYNIKNKIKEKVLRKIK